jgi:two-component system LytT family response regulator
MFRAIVVDDEVPSRESLMGRLKLFCPEVSVVGEAGGLADAMEAIRELHPDLIFLDVNLNRENGFDLLEQIGQDEELQSLKPEVIFTTAHDEYAIKAFRFSAIDYLLKPIDPEELVKAVRRVQEKKGVDPSQGWSVLADNFQKGAPKKIIVPSSDGMHIIRVDQIIRCESDSNYTTIFLKGEKNLLASKTLKEYDSMLTEYGFERVHKSHLVNMDYVKKYIQADGGYLVLEDDSRIPVANRKKDQLMKLLKSL